MERQLTFWSPESISYSKIDRRAASMRSEATRQAWAPTAGLWGRWQPPSWRRTGRGLARSPCGVWYGCEPRLAVSRAPSGVNPVVGIAPVAPPLPRAFPLAPAEPALGAQTVPGDGGSTGSRGRGARGPAMGRDTRTPPGPRLRRVSGVWH